MDILEVKAFNSELSALYDNKPPISKAKMSAITRGAIKAIKFYKHVVHSVEKFIQKCKPEYKIPGLYVIDSIVRQSRHQFGTDKDVFAPRFSKNLQQTFINLLRCPPEDKRNIIRVLNLWQKNSVFSAEVIQPLFDMVNPNHPIHQEILAQSNNANGSLNSSLHVDPRTTPGPHATQHTPEDQGGKSDSIYSQLRQVLRDTQGGQVSDKQSGNFNRRLLNVDFEYESEDEGTGEKTANININATQINATDALQQQAGGLIPSSLAQMQSTSTQSQQALSQNYLMNPLHLVQNTSTDSLTNLGSILANPEILRHLQNLQAAQMMVANFPQLQGMNNLNLQQDLSYFDMTQPPPGFGKDDSAQLGVNAGVTVANNAANAKPKSPLMDEVNNESDIEFVDDAGPQVIEIDGNDSRSPTPRSIRRRRSRSRDRSRRSRSRSRSRRFSRSRSRDRRSRRSRDRDRDRDRSAKERGKDRERDKERDKEKEKEREKERERKKKGLPPIKRETLSVCSTTLWVGHLSKLVQAEDLSDAFGPIGEVLSIDLVPPRGCAFIVMNRRRDAYRALIKLDKQKIHNKSITVAWAPGKGVKGREWKDYWEAEAGACYVPWEKLPRPGAQNATQLLDYLEEGGMLDDETLPPWLHRKGNDVKPVMADVTALTHPLLAAANSAAGMMVVPPLGAQTSAAQKLGVGVDATRLPTPLAPLGFPPHPALPLPLLPLQAFKPQPQPGLQQALHLQAMLAHQQQHQQLAAQLLLGPPPRLPAVSTIPHPTLATVQQPLSSLTSDTQKDDSMDIDNADDMPVPEMPSKDNTPFPSGDGMSDKLKNLVSQPPPVFNVPPPMLGQMPPTHIMPPNTSRMPPMPPGLNTSQPPPSFDKQNNSNNANNNSNWEHQRGDSNERDRDRRDRDGRRGDRDRDRRDRDGGRRDRHDRDRDVHRERDRGDIDRDRNRDRSDRDRERAREKVSRWRDNSRERHDGPGVGPMPPVGERSLQDRLWEMANGPGARSRLDQNSPPLQHRSRERSRPKDGPPSEGLLGEAPIPLARALSPSSGPPVMGRSPLLPHMAPFRIGGRDDIRMRGMGPRGPMGPMRPGVWMDGPNPQFGPRFGAGPPPFNRPPFDGPPFEGPPFRDGMDGPPFNGIKSRFERPPFEREFDRPFDRQPFDGRPPYEGIGRPPFDEPRRPPFDRPGFEEPYDDRPAFEGPRFNRSPFEDHDADRVAPVRSQPPRGLRNEREGRKHDGERVSRWAVRESPKKQTPSEQSEQISKATEEKSVSESVIEKEATEHSKTKNTIEEKVVTKEVAKEQDHVLKTVAPSTDSISHETVQEKITNKSDEITPPISNVDIVASKLEIEIAPSQSASAVDMFSDEPVPETSVIKTSVLEASNDAVKEKEISEPINVVIESKAPDVVTESEKQNMFADDNKAQDMFADDNKAQNMFADDNKAQDMFADDNKVQDMFTDNVVKETFVAESKPPDMLVLANKVPENEPLDVLVVAESKQDIVVTESKPLNITAPSEVSFGTLAQRKFYEPSISDIKLSSQDNLVDDSNKFNDIPPFSPQDSEIKQKHSPVGLYSPVRDERPSEEFHKSVESQNEANIETNTQTHHVQEDFPVVEMAEKPKPIEMQIENTSNQDIDENKSSQEGRSTPCRDEPSPASVVESTEQTDP